MSGIAESENISDDEDACKRCGCKLPDDRTHCEDCEAVVILEQLEPGERAI